MARISEKKSSQWKGTSDETIRTDVSHEREEREVKESGRGKGIVFPFAERRNLAFVVSTEKH